MANPWDPRKIKKNLEALAGIRGGDKIQFLNSGDIRVSSWSIRRSDRDSITNVRAYNYTTKLFEEAVWLSKQAGASSKTNYRQDTTPPVYVSIQEIKAAYQGLRHLEQTYSYGSLNPNSPPSGEGLLKSRSLQLILNKVSQIVQGGLSEEPSYKDGVRELHESISEKYKSKRLVKINQHEIMGVRETGMCALLVTDWVRRMLISGKSGFQSNSYFRRPDDARMLEKMQKRYRPITAGYLEGSETVGASDKWVRHPISGTNVLIKPSLNRDYDRLAAHLVGKESYRDGLMARRNKNPRPGEGGELWQQVLKKAQAHVYWQNPKHGIFHLEIIGTAKGYGGRPSHTLGFETGSGLNSGHFFDPNFGEFKFDDKAGIREYCQFFDDIWRYYAVLGLAVDYWKLFCWSKVEK